MKNRTPTVQKNCQFSTAAEEIRKEIRASDADRAALHDVIAELIPIADFPGGKYGRLPSAIIDAVIDTLTEDELFEAGRWSVGDTVVRDNIYERLRDAMPIEVQNAINDMKNANKESSNEG